MFRDSCKSCKRNLGGGRVTDPILCLFIILRFLAQNHIFITFWKYSFMKVVRVVRGISRGGETVTDLSKLFILVYLSFSDF